LLRTLSLMLLIFISAGSQAQDIRYVSDKQYIPLRSGAGSDYRIVHRGIPSGTRLNVQQSSSDGVWAEITTDGGTNGWIRSQYLMEQLPAQNKVDGAERKAKELTSKSAQLSQQLQALREKNSTLTSQLNETGSELGQVSDQFTQLKQISGKAVQLDADNRQMVEVSETLRSEVEMLEAENQRLQNKLNSEAFMNGALAVMLGVIITLVVPRLWPKKRRNSSWA
jgi:SH3 domain protein